MTSRPQVGDRSVTGAATEAGRLLAEGGPLSAVWRYTVLQLLDDYTSAVRHHGLEVAVQLWQGAPPSTGDTRVDAAFAALAEHLARRDGWPVPSWVSESARWWFVTDLVGLPPRALVNSPLSFRKRGVYITCDALVRV